VKRRTGLSRSAIYNRIRDGSFPRGLSLGGRSRGWLEREIQGWIEMHAKSREHERRGGDLAPAAA
jgi:prophage regulatory protein